MAKVVDIIKKIHSGSLCGNYILLIKQDSKSLTIGIVESLSLKHNESNKIVISGDAFSNYLETLPSKEKFVYNANGIEVSFEMFDDDDCNVFVSFDNKTFYYLHFQDGKYEGT